MANGKRDVNIFTDTISKLQSYKNDIAKSKEGISKTIHSLKEEHGGLTQTEEFLEGAMDNLTSLANSGAQIPQQAITIISTIGTTAIISGNYMNSQFSEVQNLNEEYIGEIIPKLQTLSSSASGSAAIIYEETEMLYNIAYNNNHNIIHDQEPPGRKKVFDSADTQVKKIQNELDDYLIKIDEKFLDIRKGAWDVLKLPTPDKISQATNSIQDLADNIMRHLAPNEIIKKQPWFKPDPGSKSGITRRHRITLIVSDFEQGKIPEETIVFLDKYYKEASKVFGEIQGIKHHGKEIGAGILKTYLFSIEKFLHELLKRNKLSKNQVK